MLAIWVAGLRALVLAADGVLIALCVLDFLRAPAPARFVVSRHLPERAGLSQPFTRRLIVSASGPRQRARAAGSSLEVFEERSAALEPVLAEGGSAASSAARPARFPATGVLELATAYRASRRGSAWLGRLRLRVGGPFGLLQRQARHDGKSTIEIHPALARLSETLALVASERWRDLGVRRLRRRGGLTEFESLREYVAGDEVRLVDWKATARRGRPIVRELQEERGQELVLALDCGRRMAAPGTQGALSGWTKLDHAIDTALQIAAVALQQGDRVGVLAFDARVRRFVAPARGRAHFARLEQALFAELPALVESDFEGALREVAVRHRRRATLIVLSDVADPLSIELQGRALAAGARHHRILFASLDDPDLRRLAEDPAPRDAALADAARLLEGERRESLARLRRYGLAVVDALPAEAAGPVLAAWLDAKRAGWG